jgi:hypothetical protein
VLPCCLAVALAGCGAGSSSTTASTAETRLVSLANEICRESLDLRATGATVEARRDQELAKLRSLASADRQLPRVHQYLSDLHAQDRLRTELRRAGNKAYELDREDVRRLDLKIQADEKALGLTACIGSLPE